MTVQNTPIHHKPGLTVSAVNWNDIEDDKDVEVWNRLTGNFWLPEKIPLSNDIKSWSSMSSAEKQATMRVFTGLTMLDTVQGTVGAPELMKDARTPHEEAVYGNITFMEALTADMELLTDQGWESIARITEDDLVAQFDPDTGAVTFCRPKIVEPHFSHEVYLISSKNTDYAQRVSGGHRVMVEEKNEDGEWVTAVHEARELAGGGFDNTRMRIRSSVKAPEGPGMTEEEKIALRLYSIHPASLETVGKTVRAYCPRELAEDVKSIGWDHEIIEDQGLKFVKIDVTVPDEYTDVFSLTYRGGVGNWTAQWCRDALDLIVGKQDYRSGVFPYSTSDCHTSDFVGICATLCGLSVCQQEDAVEEYVICYTDFIQEPDPGFIEVTPQDPEMVYCVQVPTTYILVRNVGCSPVVTGNCVHAKSYSSIFMTLASTPEINDAFNWSEQNRNLQSKADIILDHYQADDPLKKKVASTLLESFLFYSGFYLPLYWSSHAKLTNTADIIRLIIRDEAMTADHDLLTPDGWKPIAEITENDLVAQYDLDGSIEFVHPVKTSHHYEDSTWLFENEQGHVRQHVSPNHRMLIERDPGEGRFTPEVVTANELSTDMLDEHTRFINGGTLTNPGGSEKMTAKERLLTAVLSCGSTFDADLCTVTLPELPKEKTDRIKYLAQEAGCAVLEGDDITLSAPGNHSGETDNDTRVRGLGEVTGEWCRDFIEEVSYWEGTDSKIDPDYIQAVAALSGNSRTLRSGSSVQVNRGHHTGAVDVEKTLAPGEEVYCVQVPSTYLLTRNGNSVTVTGNCVHGYYIGYKFQQSLAEESPERQEELKDFTFGLLYELYENECQYTEDLYDPLGITEDVKRFLRYNANKALNNLGYEGLFPADETRVTPAILSALNPSDENHDFFSGSGSSYVMGIAEDTQDDDWDVF